MKKKEEEERKTSRVFVHLFVALSISSPPLSFHH